MSFFASNRSFARAAAQYEAQMPPDDGGEDCPDCDGRDPECPTCEGIGTVYPPSRAEIEAERAERRADQRRDEGL
ncbi:MAG: hypothetical protein WCS42_08670 [Verrucomicrobiota bacterium]